MYTTCLFCRAGLGSNDAIEHFPVGERLAFDAATGRLWVVCRRCCRWNLTPLEERWEAIEECERLFRGSRLRASTEQIGLARLPGGTELVRIGRPRRPEFAAWRYGDRFRSRYRRASLLSAGMAAYGTASLLGGSTVATLTAGPVGLVVLGALLAPYCVHQFRVVTRVPTADGGTSLVRAEHADEARLVPVGARDWRLEVPHASGVVELQGALALRTAGLIFAHRNAWGAAPAKVQRAVGELERVDHPEAYLATAANLLGRRIIAPAAEPERHSIKHLPLEVSLAVEMATNEEAERQAIEGELRWLEQAWREAEEIAAIADALLVPHRLAARLRRLREGRAGPTPSDATPTDA